MFAVSLLLECSTWRSSTLAGSRLALKHWTRA